MRAANNNHEQTTQDTQPPGRCNIVSHGPLGEDCRRHGRLSNRLSAWTTLPIVSEIRSVILYINVRFQDFAS
jgi:hypothetical protein